MESAVSCPMYEGKPIRDVTGDTIRPGGFTLTDRALALCSFAAGARVLDVGCGAGATVEYLINNHQLDAVGVDPSPALLEQGRRRCPGLPLMEGAGENLPFRDGEMDGVLAECTLSVMENPDRALAECCRVLKSGGWLVVTDVYARNPAGVSTLHELPLEGCLKGAMSIDELLQKIKARGFEVVLWEDHTRLLGELVAGLILAHGSMAAFWGCVTGDSVACGDIQNAVRKARPGYVLVLAKKVATGKE
ncbi:DVU_1556 family methyltransferase [Desulfallas thermosapovorans]|uniref:Ubiquinone/menaquinone biosynthesis C-methylase UbiE n=1 Tax=Desulfallas thermosapovorans DSM 6562 TaxID=1121431 RepID=A0A5S4ZP96_9FIRM|nr:class I SAM-dependent methyltransferase [Desulfallas thermosapovorans]TYO94600.1 ubiquinone/menaquinone biosynthesis C-methylase UbiE [Desulfallas thermosapovorans DSM 6562]